MSFIRDFATAVSMIVLMGGAFPAQAATETLTGNLTADNGFLAFVSTDNSKLGTQIGSGADWNTTYSLTPTALSPGTYFLQIEAVNQGSIGAIIGDFAIGAQTFSTNTTNWLASYNNTNTTIAVQPWVQPTGGVVSEGANGVNPWGNVSSISSSTNWIDGQTNGLSSCGDCTVDFSTQFTVAGGVPEPASWTLMLLGFAGVGFASYCASRRNAGLSV
jgi:PEP-CTERM motif